MLPKVKAVLVTSIAPARLKVPAPTVAAEARLLTRARPARIPTARPPKCNFIYYLLEAISIFASCEARLRFNNGLNAPRDSHWRMDHIWYNSMAKYFPEWIIPALNQFSLSIR
jgi:hypothetical protein